MKQERLTPEEVRVLDAICSLRVAKDSLRFREAQARSPDLIIDRRRTEVERAEVEVADAIEAFKATRWGAVRSETLRIVNVADDVSSVLSSVRHLRMMIMRSEVSRSERLDMDIRRAEQALSLTLRAAGVTGRSTW